MLFVEEEAQIVHDGCPCRTFTSEGLLWGHSTATQLQSKMVMKSSPVKSRPPSNSATVEAPSWFSPSSATHIHVKNKHPRKLFVSRKQPHSSLRIFDSVDTDHKKSKHTTATSKSALVRTPTSRSKNLPPRPSRNFVKQKATRKHTNQRQACYCCILFIVVMIFLGIIIALIVTFCDEGGADDSMNEHKYRSKREMMRLTGFQEKSPSKAGAQITEPLVWSNLWDSLFVDSSTDLSEEAALTISLCFNGCSN